MTQAPGWPGISPRWTSSAKEGLGTALSATSRVWFTLSHGILNEIYYPRVDQACTRDFGFLVAGDDGFFSEEKRDASHKVEMREPGVPAYRLHNHCRGGRYEIEKEIICDSDRDVVLQRITFRQSDAGGFRLYALVAPHLVNGGANNTAWLGEYKGDPMIFAEGDGAAIALACSVPFKTRSVGFVGVSDGWQQVSRDGRIAEPYERAENGNVALTGEVTVEGPESQVVVAIAFGRTWSEAAFRARSSLQSPFDDLRTRYVAGWRDWQASLRSPDGTDPDAKDEPYRISTAILRCHESPTFGGGLIASLSVPWGSDKGDDDLGGYHLVWPRDLVQTAGGFLAAGAHAEALRVLDYLRAIQEPDGHWAQNTWLDGIPYWNGLQLDEAGSPIQLVDMLCRAGAVTPAGRETYWPMVEKAAAFILRNGPTTEQDRWEEDAGYSPYTLGVTIAALLVAAEMADVFGTPAFAESLRSTADAWYGSIDSWTYARDTELSRSLGIEGYYVRITPAGVNGSSPLDGTIVIKNQPIETAIRPASATISPDALALVRFGLRAADDPRILNTIKAIDHLLKVDLPAGPSWRRYNGDGYGEHTDGSAFSGIGTGRAWPLLTGERAHYEIAARDLVAARGLARTMEQLSSAGGLIPEQVWDGDDIPARDLYRGKPTGSAMPLVWAHAEYLKLRRSLADGTVFDQPPQTVARYLGARG